METLRVTFVIALSCRCLPRCRGGPAHALLAVWLAAAINTLAMASMRTAARSA